MCELPGPIKSILIICLCLISASMAEDVLRVYYRRCTSETMYSLPAHIIIFIIFGYTTYYYW